METYEQHMQRMLAAGGAHECASDCPMPPPRRMTEDRVPTHEPRTEAGRAHRRYLHAIVHGQGECGDWCECHADILAIEAEASAQPAPPLDVERLALALDDEGGAFRDRDNRRVAERILVRLGSAPSAPPLDVRPEVAAFASMMERVLRDNDHKGGWQDCEPSWLLDRLRQEVNELDEAMRKDTIARRDESGRTSDWPADVSREAADVANFAMMIVDVLTLGSAATQLPPDEPES